MKTQTLVLDRLTKAIEDAEQTPTIEKDYANTGYLLALNEDLDVEWAIRFDFQTTYFTLELFKGSPQYNSGHTRASTINGAKNSHVLKAIIDGMAR